MRTATLTLTLATLLALPPAARAQWTNDPYNGMAPVCMAPGEQAEPLVGRLESTGYTMYFWMDYRIYQEPRSYYQVLNQSGERQLEPDGRPVVDGPSYWYAGVTAALADGQGGLVAVFRDARNGEEDLYGQRYDSLGNPMWAPTGLPLVLWPRNENTIFRDFAIDSLGNVFIA